MKRIAFAMLSLCSIAITGSIYIAEYIDTYLGIFMFLATLICGGIVLSQLDIKICSKEQKSIDEKENTYTI
jgi:hypothetical protein